MTDDDAPLKKSAATARLRELRASVWHLVDLKRAGHSPRFTEMQIDRHDRITRLPERRPPRGRKPAAAIVQVAMLRRRGKP